MDEVAREYDRLTALIRASEEWSDDYKEDPESFAKLLKGEAAMQRHFAGYLKDLSVRAPDFINWGAYLQQLDKIKNVQAAARIAAADAFNLEVMFDDSVLDHEDDIVLKVVFDDVTYVVTAGASATQTIYSRQLESSQLADVIAKTARRNAANLVGKRVDKDGNIVDNPKAEYSISNGTRQQIKNSIRDSLSLNETQTEATARLTKVLKNPDRAELVAQTEAVNGYQGGMYATAKATGATGKSAQYLGPSKTYNRKTKTYTVAKADLCGTNADEGVIPIDQPYQSGHMHPGFHPRCRCGEKFHWPEGV